MSCQWWLFPTEASYPLVRSNAFQLPGGGANLCSSTSHTHLLWSLASCSNLFKITWSHGTSCDMVTLVMGSAEVLDANTQSSEMTYNNKCDKGVWSLGSCSYNLLVPSPSAYQTNKVQPSTSLKFTFSNSSMTRCLTARSSNTASITISACLKFCSRFCYGVLYKETSHLVVQLCTHWWHHSVSLKTITTIWHGDHLYVCVCICLRLCVSVCVHVQSG